MPKTVTLNPETLNPDPIEGYNIFQRLYTANHPGSALPSEAQARRWPCLRACVKELRFLQGICKTSFQGSSKGSISKGLYLGFKLPHLGSIVDGTVWFPSYGISCIIQKKEYTMIPIVQGL